MTTTTDRATELRAEIEGAFALSAYHYATGRPDVAANFAARVDELREELEGLS